MHLRESMVEAAKSKRDEEAREIRRCMKEKETGNARGLQARVCGVAREKKMERKRGTDEGCYRMLRIYERKRGARSGIAAGDRVEVKERRLGGRINELDEEGRYEKVSTRNAGGSL